MSLTGKILLESFVFSLSFTDQSNSELWTKINFVLCIVHQSINIMCVFIYIVYIYIYVYVHINKYMHKERKMKSLSHVWLFATLMDCSLPGYLVHGIFQARVLEWVAISISRGSSWLRDQTRVFCIANRGLYKYEKKYIYICTCTQLYIYTYTCIHTCVFIKRVDNSYKISHRVRSLSPGEFDYWLYSYERLLLVEKIVQKTMRSHRKNYYSVSTDTGSINMLRYTHTQSILQ